MAAVGNTYSGFVDRDQIQICKNTHEDGLIMDGDVIKEITRDMTPAQFDVLRASFPSYYLTDVDGYYNWTALHEAADRGNTPLVRHIVQLAGEKGKALMDLGEYCAKTPLMLASWHFETAEALIDLGADVNLGGHGKETALLRLIHSEHIAIQTLLIRRKAVVAADTLSDGERMAIIELARQVQETPQAIANSTGLLPPLAKIVDQYL